jgi:hypothetical protein
MAYYQTHNLANFKVQNIDAQQVESAVDNLQSLSSKNIGGLGGMFNLKELKTGYRAQLSTAITNSINIIYANAPALGCTQQQMDATRDLYFDRLKVSQDGFAFCSTFDSICQGWLSYFRTIVAVLYQQLYSLGFTNSSTATPVLQGLGQFPITGVYAPYQPFLDAAEKYFNAIQARDVQTATSLKDTLVPLLVAARATVLANVVAQSGINAAQQTYYNLTLGVLGNLTVSFINLTYPLVLQGQP